MGARHNHGIVEGRRALACDYLSKRRAAFVPRWRSAECSMVTWRETMQMTRVLTAALILAGSLLAQSSVQMLKGPNIGIFGGYQGWDLWRSPGTIRPGDKLKGSGVLGVRASYDFTYHVGLEGAYTYGNKNWRSHPRPLASNHHFSLNPVWTFMSPGSRARPYVTAGIGAISFRRKAPLRPGFNESDLVPAFN